MNPDTPHELSIHRATEWGTVTATCTVCGPIRGTFQTATAAHEYHGRRFAAAPRVMSASACRGVSLRTGMIV